MDNIKYALLTEVQGRWMAENVENLLRAEEMDVVLIQDAVSHLTHANVFSRCTYLSQRRASGALVTY